MEGVQSNPLKENPVAQVEQMVAERQVAHLVGQGWHWLVVERKLPLAH